MKIDFKKRIVAFIRKDDNEMFTLNSDGKTYSLEFMKRNFPKSLTMKYTKKQLSSDSFRAVWR
jgi:hypothetical protein